MNWDAFEKISAIVLAIIFFVFKDVAPYLLARYHDYRSKANNRELIKDLNKQLWSSTIHFPCEMIEISAGYLIGQVIFLSKMASTATDASVQEPLILLLDIRILLCCISVLVIYPVWSLLTDLFDTMILDAARSKKEHIYGIVLCILLWIMTIAFVLFCLNAPTIFAD